MKALSILIAIVMAPVVALSQSTEPMKTKALQVNINGLTLSGINGGVGGKLWVEDDLALVGSLDASFTDNFTGAGDTNETDDKYRSWSVRFNAGVERHFEWVPGLSPYLVGGASLGANGYRRAYGSSSNSYLEKRLEYSLGLRGGFGVEYWVSRRVSVTGQQLALGEYRFGSYETVQETPPNTRTLSRDTRGLNLDLGTTSIILSLYF